MNLSGNFKSNLIAVWFGTGSETSSFVTAGIFLVACITDFVDGYLARKMVSSSCIVLVELCGHKERIISAFADDYGKRNYSSFHPSYK